MAAETKPGSSPVGVGKPLRRIEGEAKVTGAVRYPSDEGVANAAHAYLVTSSIARGRVVKLDLDAARAVPGVLDILWHGNVGDQAKPPPPMGGRGASTTTLETDRVWHYGQIITVIVAESFEIAREAAHLVKADYDEQAPAATFGSPGATEQALVDATAKDARRHVDPKVGDAEAAFAAAPVKIDARYETPTQHHNPIELFTTTCEWRGGKLTVHESSQFVHGLRAELAAQLGMDPDDVRILSRHIGGAFGGRGPTSSRTAWIAIAARRLKRPVKLEATRKQGFTIATYRAETRHRVRLAATPDGKLQALLHEGWEATSRPSTYSVAGTETVSRMYAAPNVWTKVNIVQVDRNTPGYMRSPPDIPYLFALESAMDELSYTLGIDPIELRRLNDAQRDSVRNLPYTSRLMNECFAEGAKVFGWNRRSPRPNSMREGDWLIGFGCAATTLHASIEASSVRMTLTAQGRLKIETAAHEFGNGTYTVIAQVAAERLGLPLRNIDVQIGDSNLPASGYAAGSKHCATVCNVVAKGCEQIRDRLAKAAVAMPNGVFTGRDAATLVLQSGTLRGTDGQTEPLSTAINRAGGRIEILAENLPAGLPPGSGVGSLYAGRGASVAGTRLPNEIRASFGAQFVEVRIHRRTREIRVPRALGVYAAGTIVNPITARAQMVGGIIWGLSAALHESTEIDMKRATYTNDNLAEYLVPVNADIGSIDVIMLPEKDPINELGIKGIGELGITGMNAAVTNAVFHAAGIRIRELPIRIEKLLGSQT